MGKVKQGSECSVDGCNEKAARSFALTKVREALQSEGVVFQDDRSRRAYLCQKHYKLYKKQTKKDKKIDKWRFST
ncbi:MAG: hypothetical protein ACFFAL_05995 [Promethearchaeota archaeon]